MSRIDDLITDLCPDGVRSEPLQDLGAWRGGGTPAKGRSEFWENGTIPWVSPKDMRARSLQVTKDYITQEAVARSAAKLIPPTSVVLVVRSSILDKRLPVALLPREVALNQDMKAVTPRSGIEAGYLYHVLVSRSGAILRATRKSGGSVASLDVSKLLAFRVPVPPPEVQREIVRILDQFTQLEAELEAELEARRAQYDYYRARFISNLQAQPVRIGDLGHWVGGVTPRKTNLRYWEDGEIPWLASMDVSESEGRRIRGRVTTAALNETPLRVVAAPAVVVVMRSNILRRRLPVGLTEMDTTVNQDMRALEARDGVDPEFVFQVLRSLSDSLRTRVVRTDGSMAGVDSKKFFSSEVPLPSLEKQRDIARELRSFDQLVNDLSVGLPAELAARRKQYEYYRDKLLTFPEASV